jgi:hypothetical protein
MIHWSLLCLAIIIIMKPKGRQPCSCWPPARELYTLPMLSPVGAGLYLFHLVDPPWQSHTNANLLQLTSTLN